MAQTTARGPKSDEEDIDDDDELEEEEKEVTSAPAVGDRRRRRLMKRGEYVAPAEEPAVSVQPTRKDRPTPSQREESSPQKSTNVVVRFFQGIVEYFRETQAELRKVTWLSREETLRLAYIVIVVTTISAAFLGLVSFIFGYLTQLVATAGSSIVAGIVAIALILIVVGLWLFRDQLPGSRLE